MNQSPAFSWPRRYYWLLAIVLATLVVLTLVAAPAGNLNQRGSSYSRSPDGYGAWYAYLQAQGISVQRWQKPTPGVMSATKKVQPDPPAPITLVKISDSPALLQRYSRDWVERGNSLVLLGVPALATSSPFRSDLDSSVGKVRVETSRRADEEAASTLLGDDNGAVAWRETVGKGQIIYVTTAYLAANAYQDIPSNFAFLTNLVRETDLPIWIDEYIHGYKDADVKLAEKQAQTLVSYLGNSPFALLALQAGVILLTLLWGQNRRMGPATRLTTPTVDNSTAYIQAMAGILHQAECTDFVLETVGKAEQLEIQQALGLDKIPLSPADLTKAWTSHTGQPSDDLQTMLQSLQRSPLTSPKTSRRMSNADLVPWLAAIQRLRDRLRR